MKYKWKPVLAAMLASFCLFSSPLTALATDNTVSTIEDEMVHNTEGAAEAGSALNLKTLKSEKKPLNK